MCCWGAWNVSYIMLFLKIETYLTYEIQKETNNLRQNEVAEEHVPHKDQIKPKKNYKLNIGNLPEKRSRIMIMKMIYSSLSEEEKWMQSEKLKLFTVRKYKEPNRGEEYHK